MSDDAAVALANLSRYDALLRTSKILARHQTISELFGVLADELHPLIPFDYLALIVHDESTDLLRLDVLEPSGLTPPVVTAPIDHLGPAATVWRTQKAAVVPLPEQGALHPTLDFLRAEGRRMTCFLPLTTSHRKVGVMSFG